MQSQDGIRRTARAQRHARRRTGSSQASRQADFEWLHKTFVSSYAYLDQEIRPWETWSIRYNSSIKRAADNAAYVDIIADALDELHDFHAEVRSPRPHRWLSVPTFADFWAEFAGLQAVVTAVRRGSDAQHAGIATGDRVEAIGDQSLDHAIEDRLKLAVGHSHPKAQQWALLSLLTGRADEERRFMLRNNRGGTKLIQLPLQRTILRSPGFIKSSILPGNIGLVRFNNSLGEQKVVAAFDAALSNLRETKGLIIDLRDVPSGGHSSVALGIMGRFVQQPYPYQRHRIPNYGQADVERNWVEIVTPRGPFMYEAPVVVLVDHWTGSIGEGIACGFDAMCRAVVVGTRMAGLAGAVSEFKLPNTGISLAFADEQIFHVNGVPRHEWFPPRFVAESPETDVDTIFESGLSILRNR